MAKLGIQKDKVQDIFALTPAQEGMLAHYLQHPADDAFYERLEVYLNGKVDWECFKAAWTQVTADNDALRTVFRWDNVPQPLQLVLTTHEPQIRRVHESERSFEWMAELREVPFQISLIQLEETRYKMVLHYHHIILDGWSSGLVLQEFFEAYDACLEGKKPTSKSKTPFKQFVRFLKTRDTSEQERFWRNYLKGAGTKGPGMKKLEILPDYSSFSFNRDLEVSLEDFNRRFKTTTASILYTAWGVLLAELHRSNDVLFDTTVSGRSASIEGIHQMTGLLINTLPLRFSPKEDDTLLAAASGINRYLNDRQLYENTARDIIHGAMEGREYSGFFNSLLVLENYPLDDKFSDPSRSLSIDHYHIIEKTSYDLTLIIDSGLGIHVGITFNETLFSREEVAILAARFEALVAAIVNDPENKVRPYMQDTAGIDRIARSLEKRSKETSNESQIPIVSPRDTLEEDLIEIFSEVLKQDNSEIGIDHDFFAFGGHSLRASSLANSVKLKLNVKLPLPEIFRNPTVRQLANFIRGHRVGSTEESLLNTAPRLEVYPASSAQQRMYFMWQMDPLSTAYNGPVKLHIRGKLDRRLLEQSFMALIQRHEVLRTSFELAEGTPVQRIHDTVSLKIEALDSGTFIRPFDMSVAPLMRVGLDSQGDTHTLMVDVHHIVCDGTSRDIIMRDIASLLQGQSLEPPQFQFTDFCVWQDSHLRQNRWQNAGQYWRNRFIPLPEPLEMPSDFHRPAKQSHEGQRRRFDVPLEGVRQLENLGREFGLTLFMAVQAILSIMLSKYCRSEDVVLGTAIAGRHHGELDDTVGLFMETLALRSFPANEKALAVFLSEIRTFTLDAYENQHYPFRQLLKDLDVDPLANRGPLFDVMLIVQNHQRLALQLPGFDIQVEDVDAGVAKVDLTWEVYEEANGIEVEIEYCTRLFSEATIERMWRHWLHVLAQVAQAPASVIGSLELATTDEKDRILNKFNNVDFKPIETQPVPVQLRQAFERNIDATALVGASDQWFSYGEVQRQAASLTVALQKKGVAPGDLVAVMMERTPDMLIAIIGVLNAGAAYVPLDPTYPADRVAYIFNDSGSRFAVTDDANCQNIPSQIQTVFFDYNAPLEHASADIIENPSIEPASPAYIIYTSGSTGHPKGVLVEHRNLSSYIAAFCSRYPITFRDIVMQQASITFDASCEEIWPVLLSGGRVVIAGSEEIRDVARLAERIAIHAATIIDCSPLLLGELNRQSTEKLRSLRLMINGGDVLKREYIDQLLKIGQVVNTYGPTETTICAAYFDCSPEVSDPIPIGAPVPGYRNVILNKAGQVLPVGIPGELCIAGPGVTRGYLNRPELSVDRFLETDLFQQTDGMLRMYRSGDMACWQEDGNIRFLGRIDRQVKIRGFRIELEEIETAILKHQPISAAAVIPRSEEGREAYLCAYIVATGDGELDIAQLRQSLVGSLPSYMVPAYFVTLNTLPLNASGKVDSRRLPKPERQDLYSRREFIAPRNEGERLVAAILKDLLKIERIGVHDDFFELGGDSILANRTLARIREELRGEISLRSFFQAPTVEGLARTIEVGANERICIPRASRLQEIPLSHPQERIWFLQQMDGDNSAYIIPRALRLKGKLDPALFERSLTEIVRRHEILRTVFVTVEGRPTQVVKPPFEFKIPLVDLTGIGTEEQPQAIERFIVNEGNRPFDFETGPFIRMHLLKLAAEEHILVSVEHHLIHDGWTQGVLLREFFTMYQALLENKPSPLPELPIQYADFAVWQRSYMAGERLERYIDFWRRRLDGLEPLLDFPLDSPRPPVLSGRGEMKRLVIPSSLASGLYAFGKEHGATLFMTMLAVFKVLLHRYSGCSDIVVGSGIANRRYKELEGMLGMVINTLVLRTTIDAPMRFSECVRSVKETALEAYEYEETPFDKVVEAVAPERSLSYMPIFQVMFSFMDTPTARLSLPGLEFEIEGSHNQSSKFDINVVVIPPREEDELEGEILVDWEYNTDLFRSSTMDAMMRRYKNLLDFCAHHPETLVSQLPLLEEDEKEELLITFNNTAVDYPRDLSIPQIFAREAALDPERIACKEETRAITYRELERQASALAAKLISLGIRKDEPVAITAQRSIQMIVGVLGILSAGGAYLPIFRDFPPERKHYMIEDTAARLWLFDGEIDDTCGCRGLSLLDPLQETGNELEIPGLSGDSLAYIMYTSGSTGKPKGVMVTHRNVARLVKPIRYIEVDESDCFLPAGPLEFDASTFELWGGLLNRIPICLVPKETIIDASRLKAAIHRFNATTMLMTVALFNQMVDTDIEVFAKLRNILVGGDALSPLHINRLRERFSHIFIVNAYGPTENGTLSTTFNVDRTYNANIPIGRPIANSTAYILDPCNNPQPIGVPGELWVGGDGVARGYLNDALKTVEKFVTIDGLRLYRTGDKARYLPDGVIEFMGRMDQQVKIRGFRIEPGEIENRLLLHDAVTEAVVLALEIEGDKTLVAYLVPTNGAAEDEGSLIAELELHLGRTLPAYMIPSVFTIMDKLPLTTNGKVDRRSLPRPQVAKTLDDAKPSTSAEKRLATVWAGVLNVGEETIGRHADFFKSGGHSLKAANLSARIHKEFSVKLPIAEIFKFSTLREMAGQIESATTQEYFQIPLSETKEYYPLSSAQKRLYIIQKLNPTSTVYNIPLAMYLDETLGRQGLVDILGELVKRHESLRTSFHTVEGQTVQRIHQRVNVELEDEPQVAGDFIRPFDLSRAPLFRAALMRAPEGSGRSLLLLDMHHIIGDGVSLGILEEDFKQLATGGELEPLRLHYRDYAEWQQYSNKNDLLEKQERFWLDHLQGASMELELPLDFSRSSKQDFVGDRLVFEIDHELTSNLNQLAANMESTLYMVLLTVFYILLARLSGQDDIIVGTPVAARRHADFQKIVGIFINTLAIRQRPSAEGTVEEFLQAVKQTALQAFENQEYPFDQLVENVGSQSDSSRNPLFDVMFALENTRETLGAKNREHEDELLIQRPVSRFDMTWNGTETNGKIMFTVEFRTGLFKHETIRRWQDYYKRIASQVAAAPTQKLLAIELMSEAEKEWIIHELNATSTNYPPECSINELFEREAALAPERIACVHEDQSITYRELQRWANALAAKLVSLGVRPDEPVAITAQRSIPMIVGVLGILKAGGSYLPISRDFPQDRKRYMIEDAAARVWLFDGELGELFQCRPMSLEEPLQEPENEIEVLDISGDSLAYIMYTSGSTGKPKGVMVTHRNVVRLVKPLRFIDVNESDCFLPTGPLEFDASTFELWGGLLNRIPLCLVSKETVIDASRLKTTIQRFSVTTIWMTVALFNMMLDTDIEVFGQLRNVLVGGDALSPLHINRLRERYPDIVIMNGYGPTENTTFSTTFKIDRTYLANIPIGRPIVNSTAYVLDSHNHPQPVGVPGELWVGGDGVARGYLNDPQATAEKFILIDGRRLYRTGDKARILPDGVIEFMGRMDQQVKIRGFRIEPGEIENQLLLHEAVAETVVLPLEIDGDKTLVAYIVPVNDGEDKEQLIAMLERYLGKELPAYMIPSIFMLLDRLPLTANGKVDRRALPRPQAIETLDIVKPATVIEQRLASVWAEVLNIPEETIGRHSDFLKIGGHSLKAANLVSQIHKTFSAKFPIEEIFQYSKLQEMAVQIASAETQEYLQIPATETKEYYPISSAQKRLYIIQQLDPASTVYNMPLATPLDKSLDFHHLEDILRQLVQRHESLRTSFQTVDGQTVQRIHQQVDFQLEAAPKDINEFIRPFDLSRAPLFRASLLNKRQGTGAPILLLDIHHIIGDGVSLGILEDDFMELVAGRALEPLRLQYHDYAEWQWYSHKNQLLERQERFWLEHLDGASTVLELPLDFSRSGKQDFVGDRLVFEIDHELTSNLKQLAANMESTLYMVLLTVFYILLARLSGQDDIIVGTPVAARRHADFQKIVGIFINTLAIRQHPREDGTVEEFLHAVKQTALQAFENQEYPFDQLVEKVGIQSDSSRNPLFDVMFALENTRDAKRWKNRDHDEDLLIQQPVSRFDMTWNGRETNDRIIFSVEFRTGLFRLESIRRLQDYFRRIASQVAADPTHTLLTIELMSESEKEWIIHELNATTTNYPSDCAINELFEREAALAPERIACLQEDHSVTYRELLRRSKALAAKLVSLGVRPDEPVAITAQRSISMIVGILGILKAGGSYLPISRNFPQDRKRYMIEDAAARVWLFDGEMEDVSQCRHLSLEEQFQEPENELEISGVSGDSLAYIMYTSGSTGKPKGVMVTHRNVVRLVKPLRFIDVNESDCFLPTGPLEFDASTFELWGGLLNRIPLCLVSKETVIDASRLKTTIQRFSVTTIWMTVALFNMMLDTDIEVFGQLRNILVGGDALSPSHINRLREKYPHIYIMNGYGPTENTTFSTTFKIDRTYRSNIPIGRPIVNSTAYVLDSYNHPQPVGVPGELWVGGDGVARGYLNDPQSTAEKFITIDGRRLYRTGDKARVLPDGMIEFMGRMDQQVKIRGFRIEPGEIENQLLLHEAVAETVVLPLEIDGDKTLVAYIVPVNDGEDKEQLISTLENHLGRGLPAYMIPSVFSLLDRLPLTANGKVDRRALPKPEMRSTKVVEEPITMSERRLAKLWSRELGIAVEYIGRNSDFFQLGGHSLKAANLISNIHKEFAVKMPLADVFERASLKEMALLLEADRVDTLQAIEPAVAKEFYSVSSSQQRICLYVEAHPEGTEYNMPGLFLFKGHLDRKKFQNSLDAVVERQESLRTSFHQINGITVQKIHESAVCAIKFHSCSEAEVLERAKSIVKPFKLNIPPLLRIEIFSIEKEKHIIFFDIHHSISDGTSMEILLREMVGVYSGKRLEPQDIQYKDYAEWQRNAAESDIMKQSEKFWMNQLENFSLTRIPPDHVSGSKKVTSGFASSFIEQERFSKMKSYCSKHGVSRFVFLLSLFFAVLKNEIEQDDLTIGTPFSLRDRDELKGLVGVFLNVLLLRCRLHSAQTFTDVLEISKLTVIDALNHGLYPYEWLDMKLKQAQPGIGNELFTILFNYFPREESFDVSGDGFSLEPAGHEIQLAPKYDLTLYLYEESDKMSVKMAFKANLFEPARIKRILDGIDELCTNVLAGDNSLETKSNKPAVEDQDDFFEQMSEFYTE